MSNSQAKWYHKVSNAKEVKYSKQKTPIFHKLIISTKYGCNKIICQIIAH